MSSSPALQPTDVNNGYSGLMAEEMDGDARCDCVRSVAALSTREHLKTDNHWVSPSS
jgi:hypothetical protein